MKAKEWRERVRREEVKNDRAPYEIERETERESEANPNLSHRMRFVLYLSFFLSFFLSMILEYLLWIFVPFRHFCSNLLL